MAPQLRPDVRPDPVWLAVGREAADALEAHGEGLLGAKRPAIRCVADVHEALVQLDWLRVEACVVSAQVLDARPRAALESIQRAVGAAPMLIHDGGQDDPAVRRAAQDLAIPIWSVGADGHVATAQAERPRRARGAEDRFADRAAPPTAPRTKPADRGPPLPRADDDAPPAETVDPARFAEGCLERIDRLGALIQYIVRTLAEVSSAGRISLMLREPERDTLRLRAGRGIRSSLLGSVRCTVGSGIAGRVAALGRAAAGHASEGGLRAYRGTAYVVLPLGQGARCEGVVGLTGLPGNRLPADRVLRRWGRLCRKAGLALRASRDLQRARALAARDALTRLPNRRSFDNALARELRRAERDGSTVVVALFDVDRFKSINDRYGHPVGDAVLRGIARRLQRAFRDTDLVARWGGEEFAVLLPGLEADARTSEEPRRLLERARQAIRGRGFPLGAGMSPARVTVSAGFAVYRQHGETASDLIKSADDALLQAKETGRDRILRAP